MTQTTQQGAQGGGGGVQVPAPASRLDQSGQGAGSGASASGATSHGTIAGDSRVTQVPTNINRLDQSSVGTHSAAFGANTGLQESGAADMDPNYAGNTSRLVESGRNTGPAATLSTQEYSAARQQAMHDEPAVTQQISGNQPVALTPVAEELGMQGVCVKVEPATGSFSSTLRRQEE